MRTAVCFVMDIIWTRRVHKWVCLAPSRTISYHRLVIFQNRFFAKQPTSNILRMDTACPYFEFDELSTAEVLCDAGGAWYD